MFPNSHIDQSYQIASTKVIYVIKDDVVHVKKALMKEISGKPFTFQFDEITKRQVKEQYNGYIIFFLKINILFLQLIVALYLLLDALLLMHHFHDFFAQTNLDVKLLLSLGMDEPTVNVTFKRLLLEE